MPKTFQLAIQGGGARLADLLAAVEVIDEYRAAGKIRITNIAGTSAGAIAAAVLAVGDVAKARAYFDKNAPAMIRNVIPDGGLNINLSTVFKLWRNQSLCKISSLRTELTKLFKHLIAKDGTLRLSDAKNANLIILTASVATREKHVFRNKNEDLIEALLNSCAIPLVARGAAELSSNPYVDGGLCENLPSEELSKDVETDGEVIAISFPNKIDGTTPETTIQFLGALFSTAINNSVQRAASQFPTHALLQIDTELGTFDFHDAFDLEKRRTQFENIRHRTEKWLDANLSQKPSISPVPIFPHNEGVEAIMADLYKWYAASQAILPRRSLRNILRVTANSLRVGWEKNGLMPDVVEKWYHFAPIDVSMNCFHIEIGLSEQQVLFTHQHSIEVWDPDGRVVSSRVLPTIDRSHVHAPLAYRGYLVLFEPSLPPMPQDQVEAGRCYKARYVTEIPGAMRSLFEQGSDYIQNENTRSEVFERVEIILSSPKSLNYEALARVRSQGEEVLAKEMTATELRIFEEQKPLEFGVRGWKTENFRQNSEFRIDFKRISLI